MEKGGGCCGLCDSGRRVWYLKVEEGLRSGRVSRVESIGWERRL